MSCAISDESSGSRLPDAMACWILLSARSSRCATELNWRTRDLVVRAWMRRRRSDSWSVEFGLAAMVFSASCSSASRLGRLATKSVRVPTLLGQSLV
ncbi:MAG: hypothetical protein FWD57_14880 [Polyangiaceae bacterium]|nr:hypothetical protein [Polyangiaceae bacterium]